MKELEGRIGIVTGGSSGIGYTIANVLAEKGACVYAVSRTGKEKTGSAPSVPGVIHCKADVTDRKQMQDLVLSVAEKGLDFLINNAGITQKCRAESFPMETFEHILEVNVTSLFALSPVSYTHLDVYKRQVIDPIAAQNFLFQCEAMFDSAAAYSNETSSTAPQPIADRLGKLFLRRKPTLYILCLCLPAGKLYLKTIRAASSHKHNLGVRVIAANDIAHKHPCGAQPKNDRTPENFGTGQTARLLFPAVFSPLDNPEKVRAAQILHTFQLKQHTAIRIREHHLFGKRKRELFLSLIHILLHLRFKPLFPVFLRYLFNLFRTLLGDGTPVSPAFLPDI